MKKLLNISVIAALAILPMAANATDVAGDPGNTNADAPVATNPPKYSMAQVETNDGNLATAGYVKGAYNAAIKAVNKVAVTAGNAANQDLSNLSATGTGVITSAVTSGAAGGTFTSTQGLSSTTLGTAIDELASEKADAATTLAGYGITDGADTNLSNLTTTGKGNVSAKGTVDLTGTTTYDAGTIGKALVDIKATADGATDSANVGYDGTTSGLTADDVQEAIDELASEKADAATTLAGYGITDAYTKTETQTGVLATIDAATVPVMATWGSNTATTISVDAPANYLETAPVAP